MIAAAVFWFGSPAASAPRSDAPIQAPVEGFATSQACRECHPREFATWGASYHRTMTQVASPDSVLGNFDDVELATMGSTFKLHRDGERFSVELPAVEVTGGTTGRREIALCTGSHHMQVYWYPVGASRVLGQLPFVFLKEARRWIPRNAAFLRPPDRAPTDERGRWNQTCIKCHTTGARPAIEDDAHMNSRVAEFGIACEACHGAAAAHVAAKRAGQGTEQPRALPPEIDVVNPSELSHDKSSEVCGQCHSVSEFASDDVRKQWQSEGFHFRPGGDLREERSIVQARGENLLGRNMDFLRIVASAFWRDGMVRVAGREYNGLLESACFQRGEMSCLSCHTLHKAADDSRPMAEWADGQLGVGMRSNAACTQCHEAYSQDDAVAAHTHHAATSSGSSCYNCHMPYTSYGLLKATRSHQISNPSAVASVTTGRPNACNQCHLDKTLDWTAGKLSEWYGAARPPLSAEQRRLAASVLWTLEGDAGQRALMAWSLGWQPAQQASGADWLALLLAQLMNDPYDAVRYMADRSLRTIAGYRELDFDFLAPPAERDAATKKLLDLWEAGNVQQAAPRIGKQILLNADGSVQREELERLLRARDNRAVTLVE